MKNLVWVLWAFILFGCGKSQLITEKAPMVNPEKLTNEVIIIADSQERLSLGTAQFKATSFVDKAITDVTQRPSQQELFSKFLMKSIIQKEKLPVIHLGDILDMSCRHEWNQIKEIFEGKKKFALLLGNHDGFLQGNFYSQKLISSWAGLCDEGRYYDNQHHRELVKTENKDRACVKQDDTIATKPYLINEYLSLLAKSRYPSLKEKVFDQNGHIIIESAWENDDKNDLIQRIAWRTCINPLNFNQCQGYSSYLLQLIKLPKYGKNSKEVYLLMLDTSQYNKPLNLTVLDLSNDYMAGVSGRLQNNQREKILEWVKQVTEKEKGYLLIAGHHPFSRLDEYTRSLIKQIVNKTGINFYLSAHTHEGWWHNHKNDQVKELNVGSISDWPIHYRTFSVSLDSGRLLVQSKYRTIDLENVQDLTGCNCDEKWLVENKDSPLSIEYQENNITAFYWKDLRNRTKTILRQYKHMLNFFPDGNTERIIFAKIANEDCEPTVKVKTYQNANELSKDIDKTLEGFDSLDDFREAMRLANTINDYFYEDKDKAALLNAYKICSAIWASRKDAEISPAKTFVEATGAMKLRDLFRNRYRQAAEFDQSRAIDSVIINR